MSVAHNALETHVGSIKGIHPNDMPRVRVADDGFPTSPVGEIRLTMEPGLLGYVPWFEVRDHDGNVISRYNGAHVARVDYA